MANKPTSCAKTRELLEQSNALLLKALKSLPDEVSPEDQAFIELTVKTMPGTIESLLLAMKINN